MYQIGPLPGFSFKKFIKSSGFEQKINLQSFRLNVCVALFTLMNLPFFRNYSFSVFKYPVPQKLFEPRFIIVLASFIKVGLFFFPWLS